MKQIEESAVYMYLFVSVVHFSYWFGIYERTAIYDAASVS